MEAGCGCRVTPPSSTIAVLPDLTVLSVWTTSSRELAPAPAIFHVKSSVESVQRCLLYSCLFVKSDIECKELQLSEDQGRSTKPVLSLTSSQDHHKQLRTKVVKMKTKLKAAPYPEVGQALGLFITWHYLLSCILELQEMNFFHSYGGKCFVLLIFWSLSVPLSPETNIGRASLGVAHSHQQTTLKFQIISLLICMCTSDLCKAKLMR